MYLRALNAVLIGGALSACNGIFKAQSEGPPRGKAIGPSFGRSPSPQSATTHHTAPRPQAPDVDTAEISDRGIFPDLDEKVVLECPSWLSPGPFLAVSHPGSPRTGLSIDGIVVCQGSSTTPHLGSAKTESKTTQDCDGDGIFDAIDILRGAKKTVLNGAAYRNNYLKLDYPGGDVPRAEGVCTDVIVRALRNAGWDLQELIANDIDARPGAYPMVKKPDPNIDHRRVRTLLPYFEHAFLGLPTSHEDNAEPYLPGDIIFMNTIGDGEPEHLGIISDRLDKSGFPLVINNWTVGTTTREMDLLGRYAVTHRFRVATPVLVEGSHQGLTGVLARHKLVLPKASRQVLLVTTPLWTSSGGTLRRFERNVSDEFHQTGEVVPVRIGERGLATGRGLHVNSDIAPYPKKEGDKRAPAGVFELGVAFGRSKSAPPLVTAFPYRAIGDHDYWIDDPKSPAYNRLVTVDDAPPPWSAERMSMYSLGIVIEHNTKDTERGAGSAIFLHPWKAATAPTVGCTALSQEHLLEIMSWLDAEARPVIVQVADRVY